MPSNTLPRYLDLRKLVTAAGVIRGELPLESLPRLEGLRSEDSNIAEVDLAASLSDEGYRCLTGRVHAILKLQCQRCLEDYDARLEAEVALGLLWSETEAVGLPKNLDPLVVGTEAYDLYGLVEEELLLAMPIVALHDPDECSVDVKEHGTEPGDNESTQTKPNPFSVLSELKKS